MGRKRRLRFHISLTDLETPEFSLKELCKGGRGGAEGSSDDGFPMQASPDKLPREIWQDSGKDNVITMLERKYCGQFKVRTSDAGLTGASRVEGGAGAAGANAQGEQPQKRKRAKVDDEYDLNDPFVDDSELIQVFEKQEEAETTVTRYSGFFVNSGDLEVTGRIMREEEEPVKKRGRKKKAPAAQGGEQGGGSSNAKTPSPALLEDSGGPIARASSIAASVSPEYWPPGEAGKAALSALTAQVGELRARGVIKASGSEELYRLPDELRAAVLAVELAVRGGTRTGQLEAGYVEALRGALQMPEDVWRATLHSVVNDRVESLTRSVAETKGQFKMLYEKKREVMLSNRQKAAAAAAAAASAGGAGSPVPTISKGVAMDQKLKHCLASIISDLKELVAAKNLFPDSSEGALVYDDEEQKVLESLAQLWPNGSMKAQRLRKFHADMLAKEASKALAAANGNNGKASDGPADSPTSIPGAPTSGQPKRASSIGSNGSSSATGVRGKKASPAGPIGSKAGGAKAGAKAGEGSEAGAGKKVTKKRPPPPPAKPAGPMIGLISVAGRYRYNESDFEVERFHSHVGSTAAVAASMKGGKN